MDRSYSEDMRAEREDLREAAEETLNVILDLGLDGHIKWVSYGFLLCEQRSQVGNNLGHAIGVANRPTRRAVKQAEPGIRCLMLTAYDDEDALRSAIIAGADGYVVKDIRAGGLLDDIRAAFRGKRLIDPRIAERVSATLRQPADDPRFASLGLRERQVLALIADGRTNRQIGAEMHLAEKTVKNYVSSLLHKLGVTRRTEAAVFATELRRPGR